MNACSWKPQLMTLHNGQQVPSDSEEWRHECEAQHVINMRGVAQRRAYLRGRLDLNGKLHDGVLQRRGEEACQALEKTIKQIWYSTKEAR